MAKLGVPLVGLFLVVLTQLFRVKPLDISYQLSQFDAQFTTRKRPTNGAPNLAIHGALVVRH